MNRSYFRSLAMRKKTKQVGILYVSMLLSIFVGICVSIVNTRLLGPEHYGDLKFLQNLFSFVVVFLTLGIFISGSRLLAKNEDQTERSRLIGNLFLCAAMVSSAFIVILFFFSFLEGRIFHNDLGRTIRMVSPLLFVFPFQLCLESIMQGDNRIYDLSIFRIGPSLLYLLCAILFNYFVPLSLISALSIQLATLSLLVVFMLFRLKPRYDHVKKYMAAIWEENKTYGFHVYIGVLAGVATGQIAGISIGYFIDNTNVGFYSLAVTISMPLTMLPGVVGTTFFKDFASRDFIPKKVTVVTVLLSSGSLLVFLLVIKKVIVLLYPREFIVAVPLAYSVSIGCVLYGFGDFINRFLSAQGLGRELRNSAFVVGISNVLGFVLLVYFFGVKGAAFTKILSGFAYFSQMYYHYKTFVRPG
ncbi:MAG: hypothetical protein COS40_03320 [Deltaproteobacteria bacterium CG03_land_8_20_14_0_80_45_14]|nr:MAG: hypothetical protein COS40_03320 [Deltaproteobacteria bacterium CG03_land_8_20_14_0_80_45_14]